MIEVLVTILALMILMLIALSFIEPSSAGIKAMRISCVNNLKEMDLAARIWEGNHGDQYPMTVSTTNGGAMEFAMTGDATIVFQAMSNELSTPKILLCPADTDHSLATNFSSGFKKQNISYFVNLSASEQNPQMLLFGDDNFENDGIPVKSGLLPLLSTNATITWSSTRHIHTGNIAITDGSVQQLTVAGLQQALQNSEVVNNRIAIP